MHANVKSINYLYRSYCASQVKEKGGYLGIEQDRNGFLLEASCATVGVLLKNGDYVVPTFDRILSGTTAIKVFNFIENELISKQVEFKEGVSIKRIVRRDIKMSEIFE